MKNHERIQMDLSTVGVRLGVCAAALGGTAATATDAFGQIVNFSTPINVPQTTAGVYINLLTGATGTSGGAVTGWDFNPYNASGGTQLGFYWNQANSQLGGVAATSNGTYVHLPSGSTVSSASTFSLAILGTTSSPFQTTGTNTLGFQFFNENTSAINFGYMSITTTAATGYPAVINGWTIDTSGAPVVVPEPATVGLTCAAMVVGARGLRRWRKEKNKESAAVVAA